MIKNSLDQEVDVKVMTRIRKMLSIAHGNAVGGEHERDTAMKMAMKLMQKHNLDMSSMVDGHKTKEEDRIQEEVLFRDEPWSRIIVNSMAKLFFCLVYTSRRDKGLKFVFIGRESNVLTAKEMCAYLIDSVAKESRKATTKVGGTSSFKTGFRKGAADRIWARSQAMRQEAEAESAAEAAQAGSSCRALVLASVYQTEEAANQLVLSGAGITLGKTKTRKTNTNAYGHAVGSEFGNRVGLTKQIS